MAHSLVLHAGHAVDYTAKVSLLLCLGENGLRSPRAELVILLAAHIVTNLRSALSYCRCAHCVPRSLVYIVALFLGVVTPLLQVAHLCNAVAVWWTSQEHSRGRPPCRPAPLGAVLEGTVFMMVGLYMKVELILGRAEAPTGVSSSAFEALLNCVVVTSLATTSASLVLWDSAVSLKLSRELYGEVDRGASLGLGIGTGEGGILARNRGVGSQGAFLFVLRAGLRACEVAGRAGLLVALAALTGISNAAGYGATCAAANFVLLLLFGVRQEAWRGVCAAAVLSGPLLFASLPLFVDCPKHTTAAKSVAGIVCGLRALELAVAVSAAVAAFLLEADIESDSPGSAGAAAAVAEGNVQAAIRAWQALTQRSSIMAWILCLLAHYLVCVAWWCAPPQPSRPPSPGVLPTTVAGAPGPPAATPMLSAPPTAVFSPAASTPGVRSPLGGSVAGGGGGGAASAAGRGGRGGGTPALALASEDDAEDKDFWPLASGLALLLLAAGCEQAPLVWPRGGAAAAAETFGVGSRFAMRRARAEDFDTVRLIGFGEFGKVFQVRHRSTQEIFAMKRLCKEFYSRRRMVDKAKREIETLRLASGHPFVVSLIHTIESAREWDLVMEYCPRGDLQQLLLSEGSPGLSLKRATRVAAEVALALEHLHRRGIVFRDLKLENVILDCEGHSKLTDFGLAKQHASGRDAIAEAEQAGGVYESFTKTYCGSYGYAAPEVNPRRQVHGFAADMYSFGVLLLMMLMGGEVYRDTREPPWERRLPPETPANLRAVLNTLSFDFYWASQILLQPARASYRVEINLEGDVVLVPRGPHGVRLRPRPHRPPNSPRVPASPDPELGSLSASQRPPKFPISAVTESEASRRRWDLAVDLVRSLTMESPEQRGTVATLKQHPFFEEITDWRTVYPKSCLIEQLEVQLQTLRGGSALSRRARQRLEQFAVEELTALQDNTAAHAELLLRLEAPHFERSTSEGQSSGTAGPLHEWLSHYRSL